MGAAPRSILPLRILIVEDEVGIAESLAFLLQRDGFVVETAVDLSGARRVLSAGLPDLVILDLGLPDGNGLDLLRSRELPGKPAVIVLTSRDEEVDRVVGLELGADDYVTKPFSPREVVARVKAVLRRTAVARVDAAVAPADAPVRVDAERRRAWVRTGAGEGEVELTRIELDLLSVLVGRPGRVFTREELLDRVWGADAVVTDRTVDVHIKTLRRKLREAGGDPEVVETVRGVGYRMRE